MKLPLLLLSLVASVQAYRMNNYYGNGFYSRSGVDGLASTQHMPLEYQEGVTVEADTGVNNHRNYGSYYQPRDGAGTFYGDGGSLYMHRNRGSRYDGDRWGNDCYYNDRMYDNYGDGRGYGNSYGGRYSPYYNGRSSNYDYGYGGGRGYSNYDRGYDNYGYGGGSSMYYNRGRGIRGRNDVQW